MDENKGLSRIVAVLRPGGWVALWWTLYGGEQKDAFMTAIDPLFVDLARSPSQGREGHPSFALDLEARLAALSSAGFEELDHELIHWTTTWDTAGIRALYATFSPIRRLEDVRREELLDAVAHVSEHEFGGRIERTLRTSLYTARRPE